VSVVSLVPSLTETVAELGLADRLVGVTAYCDAPSSVARIGGTKNPDVAAITALAPDLVLTNAEENRPADLEALRAAGLAVHVTFPRTVAGVPPMLRGLGAVLGRSQAGDALARRVEAALTRLGAARGERALILVWRKPWMAAGADTYAADLLRCCGYDVPLDRGPDRYPRLAPDDDALADIDVVVLPSEPYAFSERDLPAVRDLVRGARPLLVDGRLLTWHGTRTATALETLG
jgi:ABC-type hemin transport system substrate-binding protein